MDPSTLMQQQQQHHHPAMMNPMIQHSSSIGLPGPGGQQHPPNMRQSKGKNFKTAPNIQIPKMSLSDEAKLVYNVEVNGGENGKTPVSVLQELLSRRGITPKYELLQIEGAIHEPVFRYRVFLNNEFVATGTGRSKKDAKHGAAKNLLDLLIGKVTPEQANQTNGPPPGSASSADITTQVVSPYDDKVMGNPIGWLQEMCMSRRWPPPLYEMELEEGLPHERQFTIACQVFKWREGGTGKSKKLAKRLAAHKMWQTCQDLPLDAAVGLIEGEEDGKSNLADRYLGLKNSKIPALSTQQSHKVSQFHKALKQSAGKNLNELQTVNLAGNDFNPVQYLHDIAAEQNFELTYVDIEEQTMIGRCQCLVQLSTLPVAVCFGIGKNSKDAQANAAHNALEYLRIMTKK